MVFNYLASSRFGTTTTMEPVHLKGLDPKRNYTVKEINLYPVTTVAVSESVYSGDYLMSVGINPRIDSKRTSVILEVVEIK